MESCKRAQASAEGAGGSKGKRRPSAEAEATIPPLGLGTEDQSQQSPEVKHGNARGARGPVSLLSCHPTCRDPHTLSRAQTDFPTALLTPTGLP